MTKAQLKIQIEKFAASEKVDFIAACSAFQSACAMKGDEALIPVIGELKLEHLGI